MGIRGFWKVIAPAAEKRSLLNLAVLEGFENDNRQLRTLIIGVDISMLIDSWQAVFKKSGLHSQAGENPELRAFFYQLCEFSKAPITLVFVFDGPGRPSIKRGKKVKTKPLWLIEHVKKVIKAFGYYFHMAPGEAEAELAQMNSLGVIDTIFTGDSDAFIFGAQHIIRMQSPKGGKTVDIRATLDMYSSDALENTDSVAFTQGGLLLFALLVGGDYNPGVLGCGPTIAHALAKCGFGEALLHAVTESSPGPHLESSLAAWRAQLCAELSTNSRGFLQGRNRSLAASFPESFPEHSVIQLYTNPLTSWSSGMDGSVPDHSVWRPQAPTVHLITAFCVEQLGWGDYGYLLKKFRSVLWEAIALRMLFSPYIMYSPSEKRLSTPSAAAKVICITQHCQTNGDLRLLRIRISTENFAKLMHGGIGGIQQDSVESGSLLIWVAEPVLAIAMRDLSLPSTSKTVILPQSDWVMEQDAQDDKSDSGAFEIFEEAQPSRYLDSIAAESSNEDDTDIEDIWQTILSPTVQHLGFVDVESDDDNNNTGLGMEGPSFAGGGSREVLDLTSLADSDCENDLILAHHALSRSGEVVDLTED